MFKQVEVLMPKAKYAEIYKDLKRKIETGEYEFQELLPSENTLVQEYDCSRNTIRRAIGDLVADGYVQTMQGKGVRIIFQPALQTSFTIGSIETFTESAKRNNQKAKTEYSCAMKSHFRKFGNQMSGSGNHLYNYASLLA